MSTKQRFFVDLMGVHDAVSGSCILGIVKFPDDTTERFAIDCGLFQEKEYEDLNNDLPFNPDALDFAIVTHNHVDHIGRLPYLYKKGMRNKIYVSKPSSILLPHAIGDSTRILSQSAKRRHTSPLYSIDDASEMLKLVCPCDYEETVCATPHIKFTMFKNGHLLGASIILMQISCSSSEEDINVLFTGDYNNQNMFFDVPALPTWVRDLHLSVIIESTYGNMDSSEMHPCFMDNLQKAISSCKSMLIPVFSLGRSQEILYILRQAQNDESLDPNIPIYLDGKLAQEYTNLYLSCDDLGIREDMRNFLPRNLFFVNKASRYDIIESKEQKIIATTSGMATYGPAQTYLTQMLSRSDVMVHFTGYVAENTLGRRLKDASIGDLVSIGPMIVKKQANVEYTTEFSAHAKADVLIDFLRQFDNLKLVLVNHGEPETKRIFADRIVNEINPKNVGILSRDYFFRVNQYGLMKTLPTKFI